MARPIRVGISHGDINGISYEIILKALADERIEELCTPVVFGSSRLVTFFRKALGLEDFYFHATNSADDIRDGEINIVNITPDELKVESGQPTAESGRVAFMALERATEALAAGKIDVLVTAPINKSTIQSDQFSFPGHTEYLQAKAADGSEALMVLFDDYVRVALVTTHLPMSEIARSIDKEKIMRKLKAFDSSLRCDFGIERPKIAVLSLNPHCGDNGMLGAEEKEIIAPAIEESLDNGVLAFGPYAADGFFGNGAYRNFDGVLAMYHDQGLAPFKALAGNHGVNFTAGLPFVRTSPDHGTGYDIAGKFKADPTSMREAIYKAIDIKRHRDNYLSASANPLRKQYEARGADKSVDLTADDSSL